MEEQELTRRPEPVRTERVDMLAVHVFADRGAMGRAAGLDAAARLRALLAEQEQVSVVFASAPSQNEFLATLAGAPGIDWGRVVAFHMDEYVGLPADAPQAFGQFLQDRLFRHVRPGKVHLIQGEAGDADAECRRYAGLLRAHPPDVICMGIGENGHIAFNDPGVADFDDPELVKVVELDERSRQQQVHDGQFDALDAVPRYAITMTVPALMAGRWVFCTVPAASKAAAVHATLRGPVTADCPATALRRHPRAMLYLDRDSAGEIEIP